jgi:hypothetical protein
MPVNCQHTRETLKYEFESSLMYSHMTNLRTFFKDDLNPSNTWADSLCCILLVASNLVLVYYYNFK